MALAWSRPSRLLNHLGRLDPVVRAGLAVAYGSHSVPAHGSPEPLRIEVDLRQPAFEVSERFLSVAIDVSQVVGGRWWSPRGHVEVGRGSERVAPFDFSRPRLRELSRALSPAYLRVGGTESDHVHYAVDQARPGPPPAGYELTLTREHWRSLTGFARDAGLDLMFTVNAGPGPRGAGRQWRPDNAEVLLRHARDAGDAVAAWELGNEVNGYWFIHGMRHQPDGAQYARDMRRFAALVHEYSPQARVAGPGSIFFPVVGRPMEWKFGLLEEFLGSAGDAVDVITWHFYPQQSRRCPVATRRASLRQLQNPAHLDEVTRWSRRVRQLRDAQAPGAETWLGETGHAQCGGEPELSDRYASGLWWLDQLGSLARDGQSVVVRQTLVGSDYGLLQTDTLEPTPDYFNSVLWKRLMGRRVLDVRRTGDNPYLRAYAHCEAGTGGGLSLLLLNLHPDEPARVDLAVPASSAVRYDLSSPDLGSRELYLGGRRLSVEAGLPLSLEGREFEPNDAPISIPAQAYSFLVLRGAVAPACSLPG